MKSKILTRKTFEMATQHMIFSNLEYIPLRLIRKFIFTDYLLSRFGWLIPYYKVNQGVLSPLPIIDMYWKYSKQAGIDPLNVNVLEVGTGSTNATGYELAARSIKAFWGYEPFSPLDKDMDHKLLMDVCKRYNRKIADIQPRVKRISNLTNISDNTIDIVFSHSVLEHVNDLKGLLCELKRVLKRDGHMIHIVGYRDHFFKYPFHFLQFSEIVWNLLFNPGDLPRHRLDDHLKAISNCGLSVKIINKTNDYTEFNKIKNNINECFKNN